MFRKKIIMAKNGLVGMKGYLFFAVFKPFLNKTTFCTELFAHKLSVFGSFEKLILLKAN